MQAARAILLGYLSGANAVVATQMPTATAIRPPIKLGPIGEGAAHQRLHSQQYSEDYCKLAKNDDAVVKWDAEVERKAKAARRRALVRAMA